MKILPLPSQAEIQAALTYDPETGILRWRRGRKCAGREAGTKMKSGIAVQFGAGRFYAHRLAYVYVHGDVLDTETQIDHRDLNTHYNAISNLRRATHGQNQANCIGWTKTGLPKGVNKQPDSDRYRARIRVDGRLIYLGLFLTAEDANRAYMAAAVQARGEFARAGI